MKLSDQIKETAKHWLMLSDGEILKMRKSKRNESVFVYYSNGNVACIDETLFINNKSFAKIDMFNQLKLGIPKIIRVI